MNANFVKTIKASKKGNIHMPSLKDEQSRLKTALTEVERIRLRAKRELELARKIRVEAERYQQETETKARSQAQLLILQARLSTQREIADLKRKATEEIQKVLADIRTVRITAQEELETQRKSSMEIQKVQADIRMVRITAKEELETQRKFTNASRLKALSHDIHKETRRKREKATITA